jgi:hypothetical protein
MVGAASRYGSAYTKVYVCLRLRLNNIGFNYSYTGAGPVTLCMSVHWIQSRSRARDKNFRRVL